MLEKVPMGMLGVAHADPGKICDKLRGILPVSMVWYKKYEEEE